jgi:hypothetical protein
MAINTYRFWMATDANRLLANQNAFIQAAAPAFYQGNVAQLELHIVASAGVGTSPIEVPFPAGAAISVAVGDTNTYPTGGAWGLFVGTSETEPVPYNATTIQVADALNALTEVSTEGGVTVSKTGDGYTITWNTLGSKPTIGIGSDTLTPSSYESISLVQEGSAERRQIVFVELRQNPIALSTTWTALPTPSVTVSEVQAWNGTNRIWRISIDPQPRAGTMTISYGSKTAIVAYNASTSSIASLLSPAQVFSTGQSQWDISISEDSVLTASGSLVGYNGFSGSINFATAECHQFLAGAERKSTTLEVSISVDSKRYTLIQTACNVFADVVSDGVLVPLTLGTAISEQVANARFVRRDTDQNPDITTENQIWENLGLFNNAGHDVISALSLAVSPSSGNAFVTFSDLSSIPLNWGSITGTLSDQTDLQGALDDKYDASNPDGYLNATTGLDYFYPASGNPGGFATQAWVIGQNYLVESSLAAYATQSWVNSQDYLTSSDASSTYLSKSGNLSGLASKIDARNNLDLGKSNTVYFNYVKAQNLSETQITSINPAGIDIWDDSYGSFNIRPNNGLKFPDGTVQTTAGVSPARGLPSSGTTGQVLSKASGTNYDVTWTSITPGDRYLTTSTTINTISNGVKTFTVGTGLSYTTQQDVTIAYNASHHMHALVTSYDAGTGVLLVDVSNHTGTGTYSAWTVNVGGTVPLASVAWGDITGTLGSQTDLATALNDKLNLSGGAMTGAITMAGATIDSEMSSDYFGIELSADHSQFAELTYNHLTVANTSGSVQVTPTGVILPISGTITFGDGSLQNTAGYPNSNPSGFVTSGDVSSYYYPLSNPSGFINDSGLSYGPLYARQNGGWTSFTVPPTPSTSEAVWYYGGWQYATIKNVYDSGSYSYYNVLTF